MISEEITNQMSRKHNEIKSSFNSQIRDAISTAIAEKVFPSIQNTLGLEGRASYTMVDRGSNELQDSPRAANSTMANQGSSGLQRNPEVETAQKTWENRPRTCFKPENHRQTSRDSSVDSYYDEQVLDNEDASRCTHESLEMCTVCCVDHIEIATSTPAEMKYRFK